MNIPETQYARNGNMHIAYQVIGEGRFDLLFVHGWISHIEHLWEEPSIARFFHRLASFSRLILLPTLEERMDDVRAVLDAAGCERAALIGTSEAGALNLLFAASNPHRTIALILLTRTPGLRGERITRSGCHAIKQKDCSNSSIGNGARAWLSKLWSPVRRITK
jgi:pimeloyl-ACP methyl ester carboxylesterase